MLTQYIKNINNDWKDILLKYPEKLKEIEQNIKVEKDTYETSLLILPPLNKVFSAFNYFNRKDLKVVFIGQDCYHGRGQANGLCFSVPEDIKNPPSLRNILKELCDDIGLERTNSNFSDLASQGILFLNSALTVREKCPESHSSFWIEYTNNIIEDISNESDKIIFVLWGNYAKSKKKLIDTNKHYILEAVHPSPLAANRGGFFGCKHFSKINEKLKEWSKQEIIWDK